MLGSAMMMASILMMDLGRVSGDLRGWKSGFSVGPLMEDLIPGLIVGLLLLEEDPNGGLSLSIYV